MARVPTKHDRDQPLDFQGFLNNLQDWELSFKDKEKKLKSQSSSEKLKHAAAADDLSSGLGVNGRSGQSEHRNVGTSPKMGIVGEERRPMSKTTTAAGHTSSAGQKEHLRNYDAMGQLSSSFMSEGSSVDANSEKELGNEYFKQKKFKEAIDCYSRSLALSPTAVAYANRAMAYLKIRRFQEAEEDCTEALNLDDRYIKAYSRRSTARKELGKLKASIDDAEFALRLEPQNQEIKKQYADAKSMYEKEILEKASGKLRDSKQRVQKEGKSVEVIQSLPNSSETTIMTANQEDHLKANQSNGKKDLKSVEQLAARAASLATAEAAKNITPPTSAYQFEVSWRGLSGDRTLQTRLLKVTSPAALPQIFKNALSAPLLIDIIRCIATFFNEEVDFAVNYLENLSRVSRFDMIIMCLSSTDKADLQKIWDEVFCSKMTPAKYSETLSKLRSRYCGKP